MTISVQSQLAEKLLEADQAVTDAEDARVAAVAALRAEHVSWKRIGDLLGTSRQAAWERFHLKVADRG